MIDPWAVKFDYRISPIGVLIGVMVCQARSVKSSVCVEWVMFVHTVALITIAVFMIQ